MHIFNKLQKHHYQFIAADLIIMKRTEKNTAYNERLCTKWQDKTVQNSRLVIKYNVKHIKLYQND